MTTRIEIVPENPMEDGIAAGRKLGQKRMERELAANLKSPLLAATLGAMSRAGLEKFVLERLETHLDYERFPELRDLHPERVEYLQGLARGAKASLGLAAAWHYVAFRLETARWHAIVNELPDSSEGSHTDAHCSGVFMAGPDGALGAQSAETLPLERRPRSYRWKDPGPCGVWKTHKIETPAVLRVVRPRTGYAIWGVGNEKGLAFCCGVSCSVLHDEPIEDTWPLNQVPLLRFASNVEQLVELYTRYTLHNWNRANQVWADISGKGVVIEKSFRRIGARFSGKHGVVWCTEGYFESPEMNAYMRRKRLEHIERAGKHLGAGDLQYATDCAVRFTRIGELCHERLGLGLRHMNRVLTDHAPFPRAVCRHGGPDTAPYDLTLTQASSIKDLTHNRAYARSWIPWKKFPCQVPWSVTQYPPIPG